MGEVDDRLQILREMPAHSLKLVAFEEPCPHVVLSQHRHERRMHHLARAAQVEGSTQERALTVDLAVRGAGGPALLGEPPMSAVVIAAARYFPKNGMRCLVMRRSASSSDRLPC